MEIRERCISKKEYLKRDDSNVGYALHVQNNIKKVIMQDLIQDK